MKPNDAPLTREAELAAARPTVLAVDDTAANLNLLVQLLAGAYRVQLATSGAKALELASRKPPDIVLLDVMMPELDGYEVCRRLKADPRTREIPVIFLTALNEVEDETRAFEAGGADFVAKPFTPATLLARLRAQLELKAWRDALRNCNAWLQRELEARLIEVDLLRDTTLFVMVSLAEFRDEDTGNHVKRTQEYVRLLGHWLLERGLAPVGIDDAEVEVISKAAPLHDIGKVAMPDRVLLKPGPLTAEEWTVMQTHTARGAELLERAADRLGGQAGSLLKYGIQIARSHHERWDGSGYPDRLAGAAIPFAARLMAVADVFDALINRRPYKEPMDHERAMACIAQGSGTHFDPLVARAAAALRVELSAVASQWRD